LLRPVAGPDHHRVRAAAGHLAGLGASVDRGVRVSEPGTGEPAALTAKQRQSQSTRQKLLTAAREEFQQYGLAGGRVHRIGERAGVNKRLIYVYFRDKDGLFEEVIRRNRDAVGASVRFDAEDLPGYALRLYDYWQDHPDSVRLFWWRNLERPQSTE